ncbi:MAG: purine-binding chemotaxis protein CheW [Prolixibacteraceae bacterium]|jgi:purine-binding chemotaxis protein CheW|nr:purine-binding chemotaxis protein CheW [Prolixibacteraceae bacterium]MBT6006282.1 purine-binding chemotaxis protein CheW [Prolixibacteraceae bacterium]MBT6763682.1 purine-binding chemotaxis protein CheW [Prolixibacteraceae bacterium]MBT6998274.1 purine-binding chemotaxis protein CheW [Prolixibacteraceae bacterium]MBT7396480.1 purine-binding chemotaxis protein CheW [Prolixibacteraceae bacterium]
MTIENHIKSILKERANLLKIQIEKDDISSGLLDCIEFILEGERYAMESVFVSEVIPLMEITPLPCTPGFILGIVNVRGKIISIIDMKKFFGLPEKGITNLNRVVIIKYNGVELGILADEIVGNTKIQLNKLQSKIKTITDIHNGFILGVTKERLIVLDIKEFLLNKKLIIDDEV